jgi:hypothetical protein
MLGDPYAMRTNFGRKISSPVGNRHIDGRVIIECISENVKVWVGFSCFWIGTSC